MAAGKWNDGIRASRARLVDRLASAYRAAWEVTERTAITDSDVSWRQVQVELPLAEHVKDRAGLEGCWRDADCAEIERVASARQLALGDDLQQDPTETLSRLTIGPAEILHGPSELFVEYQLYAQSLLSGRFVAMAAYGDCRYGYIGTASTRAKGGYEASPRFNHVADGTEAVLQDALRRLLVEEDGRVSSAAGPRGGEAVS